MRYTVIVQRLSSGEVLEVRNGLGLSDAAALAGDRLAHPEEDSAAISDPIFDALTTRGGSDDGWFDGSRTTTDRSVLVFCPDRVDARREEICDCGQRCDVCDHCHQRA